MAKIKETRAEYGIAPSLLGQAIPDSFRWLDRFGTDEQLVFVKELLTTVAAARQSGQWARVAGLIDAWKETASERDDQALQQRLADARQELARGGGSTWEEVRQDLAI